ncbi:MAG: hypothetical protein AB8B56_22150 [Crocinitomicaceae bacterium]
MKSKLSTGLLTVLITVVSLTTLTSTNMKKKETKAYLEITLDISDENRAAAAGIYEKYKQPFLKEIEGAYSKELLIRTEDVQVLHGFDSEESAKDYLKSELFQKDVVRELKPYLQSDPEIRIYTVF